MIEARCMDAIFKFVYEFRAEELYAVLNSQFASSILGALLGAFAGAFAAHRIASSSKRREEIEAQIRSVNVAISTAFLICNSVLGIKNQHVESLYKKYVSDRKAYEAALKKPPISGVLRFDPVLKTLNISYLPFDILEKSIYERITISGRPLALIPTVANSIESLRSSVNHRNLIIEKFRSHFPNISDKQKLDYYFGFPLPSGAVDQEYMDTMEGIYQHLDDVIFFSALLCDDLKVHGERLRKIYKKQFSKEIDKITGFDFKTPEAVAIWPNEEKYKDWLEMFVEVEAKQAWYRRIFATNKSSKNDAPKRASS
jgi:hypothetical protein